MRTPFMPQHSPFKLAPLAAALAACALASPALAITTPVVTTLDTGLPGSLRFALTEAALGCILDPTPEITFAIPGTGPFVLSPS